MKFRKWLNEQEDIEVENPDILEVPENEDVEDLPLSHFQDLVERKGYEEIIRALQNLRRWNKTKNPSLSNWADNMMNQLEEWVENQRKNNPDFAK